jgi:putative flippase GtrA
VGAWNTVFGYSSFAVLTALLTPHIPYAYMLAGVISTLLNITVAFLNYKWFIFKTKGNYLREWFRCLMVYSSGIVLGTFLLPATVFCIRLVTSLTTSAPYIAAAILMGANLVLSFLGHRKFSFRPADACTADARTGSQSQ